MDGPYTARMRKELGDEVLKGSASRIEIYTLIDQFLEKFAAVDSRLGAIEKSGIKFRGVHQRAASYRQGDQVTHKGSLWTALTAVPEGTLPGESPAHWQLSAKGAA